MQPHIALFVHTTTKKKVYEDLYVQTLGRWHFTEDQAFFSIKGYLTFWIIILMETAKYVKKKTTPKNNIKKIKNKTNVVARPYVYAKYCIQPAPSLAFVI